MVLLGVAVVIAFVLYDYESMTLRLYTSQRNSDMYHERALHAFRSKEESEQEKENLCALIGNVAHDLKTPLQSFMSEIANLESVLSSVFSSLAGPVISEIGIYKKNIADTLLSLKIIYDFMIMAINRGINFRKAIAGIALCPQQESFIVADAIRWVVDRLHSIVGDVSVHVTYPDDRINMCPLVICDKHWFLENTLCLLSNALKFSVRGPVNIEYTLAAMTERGIKQTETVVKHETLNDLFLFLNVPTASGHKNPLYIIVIVQDNGVGVSPELRDTLFKPFRQAQRRVGGTGLGLFSIAKRMEAIGGFCGVQNRDDGNCGGCFWLAYPYKPDWVTADVALPEKCHIDIPRPGSENGSLVSDNVSSLTSEALRSCVNSCIENQSLFSVNDPLWNRVLVVEDSVLVVKAISRLWKREGFDIEVAQNGLIGLSMMKEKRYLVVLSDIQIPIMDGNEMVRRLREFEINLQTSSATQNFRPQLVIGMSANSDHTTQMDALSCGMQFFIGKPAQRSSLISCLLSEYTSHC